MSIKVSIIVPVYNTEKFLTRCLESLVNQSLQEIEIILINDCSTDDSFGILEKYKTMYPNKIIVINLDQKRGPGGARNAGMSIATGEYLAFVDSDDHVETEMFEELYRLAKADDYDMVDCAFYFEALDRNMKTTIESAVGELNLIKRKELFVHGGFIWSKIFKKDIIVNNNIRFREKVACEDIDFLRIALFYCNKINATDLILYFHGNNEDSLSNERTKETQVEQKMDSMRALFTKFKELNSYDEYRDEITYLIYKTYVVLLNYTIATESDDLKVESLKQLKDFFSDLVDYDYHDNLYILQLHEDDRRLAEINNRDCNEIIKYVHESLIMK